MATYVNNLRLKEIATGAESGTWGTSTNTNLELIADAFGSGTEAITTNADTHTTTVADGAADEGRAIYMKYTGALDSNCTITLAPNTINKFWIIENNTTDSGSSGPYSIIISQGSGANITIGNGNVSAIFTDGAGSGAAVLDALADLELSGKLTVAGASTLTGAVTMSGDVSVGDDLTLVSDAAILNFGVNSDVNLTHVHDTGLLLNSTMQLQFNDSSQYISGTSATVLSIAATDEIDLTATAVDLNGTLDVSGTSTLTGVTTHGGNVVSDTDSTDDLGTTGVRWANLWVDAITMGGTLTVAAITSSGNFVTTATGPHSFGAAANGDYQVNWGGAYTATGGASLGIANFFSQTFTGAVGNTAWLATCAISGVLNTQGTNTNIGACSSLIVNAPNINNNLASSGKPDVASTVHIVAAPTEGDVNASLYVEAGHIIHAAMATSDPSVAGALWNDSGTVKISSG